MSDGEMFIRGYVIGVLLVPTLATVAVALLVELFKQVAQ